MVRYIVIILSFVALHVIYYKYHRTKRHYVYVVSKFAEIFLATMTAGICRNFIKNEAPFSSGNYVVDILIYFLVPLISSKAYFYRKYGKLV